VQAFVSYILRGPLQAIIVTAISSVTSLILPPLAHVSGACVALVTLRKGLSNGIFVLAVTGLLLGLVGLVSSVNFEMIKIYISAMVLVWWLPVVLTAAVLRFTRSLGLTMLSLGSLCMVVMSVAYLVIGDMPVWWQDMIPSMLQPMSDATNFNLTKEELNQLMANMSIVMTGFISATIVYLTMINLFIARWMQSLLFNPGGFRAEFYGLKLDRRLSIFLLVVAAVSAFTSGIIANYALNLLILIAALYSLQGLAIVYAVVAALNAHIGWLIGLYVLMFFALPYVMLVLSFTGVADNFMDFRSRVKKQK
jgi:hypothetical protein